MELWIRSQNKEELIKVDDVRIIDKYENKKVSDTYGRVSAYVRGEYINSSIYAESTYLGEYKTKERALEILDEIQNLLKPIIKAYIQPSEEMEELLGGRQVGKVMKMKQDFEFKELSTYVYEMPEK